MRVPREIRRYLHQTKDGTANLLLVLPLVILYGVGVVFLDSRALNGADLFTGTLFAFLGHQGLAVFYGIMAIAFVASLKRLERSGGFDRRTYGFILMESMVYALLLGELTVRILWRMGLMGPSADLASLPIITRMIISVGAGLNEELVFRLAMIGGLAPVVSKLFRVKTTTAIGVLMVLSSALFSLAHFMAEPVSLVKFAYRFVAGMLFAGIYTTRGFAVAVYTHALYDIRVLLFP